MMQRQIVYQPGSHPVARKRVHNCARCGVDFERSGRQSVCVRCRVEPRPNQNLSFREKQIIGLVAQGKSNKEIAFELHLTVGTVKEYIYHTFRKLNVSNRTELALWFLRQPTPPTTP